MKRIYHALLVLLAFALPAAAQDFLPFVPSNYSGVQGVDLNPANIVDSRYILDINLTGFSLRFKNNYMGILGTAFENRTGPILPPDSTTGFPAFEDSLFLEKYLVENLNGQTKSVFLSNQIQMPLSFIGSINEKNAIGFQWRLRTYFNVDGIEEPLAHQVYKDFDDSTLYLNQLTNKRISVQQMTWAEYNFAYGRVMMDQKEHFLKVGGRFKLLQGLGAIYAFIDNLEYMTQSDSTLTFFKSEVNYGHSTNYNFASIGSGSNAFTDYYKFVSSPGVGLDIGAVYEWRPDWQKYKFDMDGETDLWMKNKNKYKLKAGLSITDIGSIKYKKGALSRDFIADINNWNFRDISLDGDNPIQSFDTLVANTFTVQNDSKDFFRMNLPTAISVTADYQIWKDFYVNFTSHTAVQWKKNDTKVHDLTMFSLAPRWDHKWFGVFLPMNYSQFKEFSFGTGVRLGPLWVGTTDLGSLLLKKKEIYGADIHFALKVPIMYSAIKDKDKDKVSDKKDKCKEVPGVWEFAGCPDRDGDHIQDSEDACPDEPGKPELNGCPDKDNDGITDKQDACPDDAGPKEFNGCPDKDGDKIIDKEDDCPDDAGLPEFKGCPDRDGDKLIDKLDKCPDKPGPIDNEGCPETVLHLLDNATSRNQISSSRKAKDAEFFLYTTLPADSVCLFQLVGENTEMVTEVIIIVSGNAKKAFRDSKDQLFRFPQKPKPPAPVVLTKQEEEILKKAFDNLEFETGKDIIRSSSFASLDELATLLKKKPTWKLKIAGHTDNVGKPAANMKLSEKRSKAVKKYLTDKGVADANLFAEWYGQTKPIASNKTPEGRQKNRRVEMTILD
ncbi:MAG: OmpA/MotB domain-containing protein [Bacteroidetes bacterium]|nr:MAG: OmpA/MotB domain-containing protein [Bacteroidota bacterium]